jgi:hypothetical protein
MSDTVKMTMIIIIIIIIIIPIDITYHTSHSICSPDAALLSEMLGLSAAAAAADIVDPDPDSSILLLEGRRLLYISPMSESWKADWDPSVPLRSIL